MNNLFFWIIVLSFLIPMAMRYYKRSVRRRNQNQGMPGGYPDQFGEFPGAAPGNYRGQQNKQPRDGFSQQDYFGGFGQLGAPQQPPPRVDQQFQPPIPYEDSMDYPGNRPQPSGPQVPPPASGPAVPPPSAPSAPQGFRARKLAELDQRYSDGELTMEDYMAQRAEVMKG
ncbi:MAG: hypothetical protein ABWX85_02960 [Arthrobacter sp.]